MKLNIILLFLSSDTAFNNSLTLFIAYFLVISLADSFMRLNISLLALLILNSFSSGLILINLQFNSFSNAFCLSISWLIFLSL